MDGWGGVVSEAFRKHAFDPYTAATGINVVDGTFSGGDEYLAQVRSSQEGEFNIAHLSGVFDYARYVNFGLTVELNTDNIPQHGHGDGRAHRCLSPCDARLPLRRALQLWHHGAGL